MTAAGSVRRSRDTSNRNRDMTALGIRSSQCVSRHGHFLAPAVFAFAALLAAQYFFIRITDSVPLSSRYLPADLPVTLRVAIGQRFARAAADIPDRCSACRSS